MPSFSVQKYFKKPNSGYKNIRCYSLIFKYLLRYLKFSDKNASGLIVPAIFFCTFFLRGITVISQVIFAAQIVEIFSHHTAQRKIKTKEFLTRPFVYSVRLLNDARTLDDSEEKKKGKKKKEAE